MKLQAGNRGAAALAGSISGTVQDGQGAVVPNAKVTLLNQAQGTVARELPTSGEGTFFLTPVNPGTYTVTVEAAGFKKYAKRDVTVFAQDRVGLPPVVLELGLSGIPLLWNPARSRYKRSARSDRAFSPVRK